MDNKLDLKKWIILYLKDVREKILKDLKKEVMDI